MRVLRTLGVLALTAFVTGCSVTIHPPAPASTEVYLTVDVHYPDSTVTVPPPEPVIKAVSVPSTVVKTVYKERPSCKAIQELIGLPPFDPTPYKGQASPVPLIEALLARVKETDRHIEGIQRDGKCNNQ